MCAKITLIQSPLEEEMTAVCAALRAAWRFRPELSPGDILGLCRTWRDLRQEDPFLYLVAVLAQALDTFSRKRDLHLARPQIPNYAERKSMSENDFIKCWFCEHKTDSDAVWDALLDACEARDTRYADGWRLEGEKDTALCPACDLSRKEGA